MVKNKIKTIKIVPDTSIIINGILSKNIKKKTLKNCEIIIPIAVLDELQSQASKNREVGFLGLEELKKLRELSNKNKIKFKYLGSKPSLEDIKLAKSGRIDGIIRDEAIKNKALLYTGDYVQAIVAEVFGAQVKYIETKINKNELKFLKFFDKNTTSVHITEGVPVRIKIGRPGKVKMKSIGNTVTKEEIEKIIKEIDEFSRIAKKVDRPIMKNGAKVIQLESFRIAITNPPFSDKIEVTIIKPIKKLKLKDYTISPKLQKRIESTAEGILVSGPPGSGKSTFASSLAEFYSKKNKIVKTIESPKDLQVDSKISQYGPLEGDFEKTAELLLLVRPDYTVFDEVRKSRDFMIFSDLRLSGVGMIGVVHASNPVNSIQRFIGRIEIGMICSIIDTVIFINNGDIAKIYRLELVMKVPTGMTERDLTRPVVEIRDFENEKLEYEIYTFGDENIIIPVTVIEKKETAKIKFVEKQLQDIFNNYNTHAEIKLTSASHAIVKIDKSFIPRIIGKGGSEINKLEEQLGINIDVLPLDNSLGKKIQHTIHESGNSLDLLFNRKLHGKKLNVYINNEYIFSATVGKKNKIRVSKSSDLGKDMIKALVHQKNIIVTDSK